MKTINDYFRDAAKTGYYEQLASLLKHPGCDPFSTDVYGRTALMRAAAHGNTSCIELLLPVSDPLAADSLGTTALMFAAEYGHPLGLHLLLPTSDVRAKANNGWTALIFAVCYGSLPCTQLLLPVSDALAKDRDGKTAAYYAHNRKHLSIIDFFNALNERAILRSSTALGGLARQVHLEYN